MRRAAHPRLYDPMCDDPILNGVECAHCGRVYFPPIGVGCEICGAQPEQLVPKPLAAVGVVHSVAEVYMSPGKTTTPFTIAGIVLDAGPLIRAMVHPESGRLHVGDRVSARWNVVERNDQGAEVVEPAFAATSPGRADA